jgi:hypothetical protein
MGKFKLGNVLLHPQSNLYFYSLVELVTEWMWVNELLYLCQYKMTLYIRQPIFTVVSFQEYICTEHVQLHAWL